jgi:hypothetical protein
MTQEQRKLLVKDLCARLPYKVRCSFGIDDAIYEVCGVNPTCCGASEIQATHIKSSINGDFKLNSCKPYLFPLSSMTEEQWDNAPRVNLTNFTFESLKCGCFTLASYTCENNLQDLLEFINWLYVNHFDVNGLIPMGLAIDATGLNIY